MTIDKESVLSLLKDVYLREDCNFIADDIGFIKLKLNTPNISLYTFEYGATKCVIIPENTDYVIKIPFTGTVDDWYDKDEYHEFEYGEDDDRPWDYCMNEVLRYQRAKEAGMEGFFAETRLIGYKDGFPIYVQEKCVCARADKKRDSKYSLEEKNKTLDLTSYSGIDVIWLTDVRMMYGDEVCKEFVDYVDENEWNDDLRASNLGYKDGRPVVIDYSSYMED